MPPIMPKGCLPEEQRYVRTITANIKKDEKGEKEQQMTFYPPMKDMTPPP
jgi:hypothetical protein